MTGSRARIGLDCAVFYVPANTVLWETVFTGQKTQPTVSNTEGTNRGSRARFCAGIYCLCLHATEQHITAHTKNIFLLLLLYFIIYIQES